MRRATNEVGMAAEDAAVSHMRKSRLRILERNFRCKVGEIDVVAQAGKTLVFVEVRSLSPGASHRPAETISRHKQHRIIRAAQWYLKGRGLVDTSCRFDVAEVYLDDQQRPERVNYIEHAFTA